MMMEFSVLMSLYYRENPDYLRECLSSLAAQSHPAKQIVLVYDGPIGASLEKVVDEFTNRLPIEVVRLPENVGLGMALNIGLSSCRYGWIFRMDTDDICLQDRFAKQCHFISTHPEVDVFGGQIIEFSDTDAKKSTRQVPQKHADIIDFMQRRNPFNHMTVAYKKTSIEKAGGYQHHLYMEDYNLWLRMLSLGAVFANLPDTLVRVRAGKEMLARRRGTVYIRSEWALFRLKRQLNIQSVFPALYFFILRTIPRILPSRLLAIVYKILRN